MTMESGKLSEKQEEILSILEEKFPSLPPREDIISVLQETQLGAQGLSIERAMLKDIKELSDGEIKVAISTVNMTLENCMFQSIASDLKAFADKFGFDVLLLLAGFLSDEQQPRRQIAVYSENIELCGQICCELEECQNPCLELEPFECGCDEILVYQQENPSVTCDQVVLLVKEVINRRCPEMVSNSRTSSTEAVAGSAPLSQGSSGIMELYGSDIEPQPCSVNFIENPPDLNDSNQAQVDVNIDLVSPDSGLATIRSSRSSKESSVFLSDDSPVGEGAGPHHNLFPGFDSYSPIPEGVVAEEHARSGEHAEHFDLFSFDPAPMVSGQSQPSSHSADYSPADDFFPNSDSSEGQLLHGPKGLSGVGINTSNYSSSSLLSGNGKDSPVEFDEDFVQRDESPGGNSERNLNLTGFTGDESPSPERLGNSGKRIPPTPMNSFVESSPTSEEAALLYANDLAPKADNTTAHTGPPQTRARCSSWWGGLEIDSRNIAEAWSSSQQESVFQSPESWRDHKPNPVERRASESMFEPKSLEFPKSAQQDSDLGQPGLGSNAVEDQNEAIYPCQTLPAEKPHLQNASQATNHLIEDFAALWCSNGSPTAMPEPWGKPPDHDQPDATASFPTWSALSKDEDTDALKNTWNLHPTSNETPSVRDLNEWALTKSGFSFPSEDLGDNSPSEASSGATPDIWDEKNHDSRNNIVGSGSPRSNRDHGWASSKSSPEPEQKSTIGKKMRGASYEKVDSWNFFEENTKKEGLDVLAPWEDSFLAYKCSDYSASNLGEDSVPSPLDTNYSTSDSYTSPTLAGEDKESENKPFGKVGGVAARGMETPAETAEEAPQSPQQPPRPRISSDPGTLEMWASPSTETSPDVNAGCAPGDGLLDTETTVDTAGASEKMPEQSHQASYDDPGLMRLGSETNRQFALLQSSTNSRHAAPDSLESWNGMVLEDTQSTATISDMDNDLDWDDSSGGVLVPGEGQARGYIAESVEPETRFSVKQLEPWGVEYQESDQADWEGPTPLKHGRDSATDGCHLPHEKSGQLIANSIWDSVMRENMSSSIFSETLYVADSEQSNPPLGSPHSSEVEGDSVSDMPETSEVSGLGAFTPGPNTQDTLSGALPQDSASLMTTMANPGHFESSDPWNDLSNVQSEVQKEMHGTSESECFGKEEVMTRDLMISGIGPGGQEYFSPDSSEHGGTNYESGRIRSLSVPASPQSEEPLQVLESEKESFNSDLCDKQTGQSPNHLQIQETCEEHLASLRNPNELSGRWDLTISVDSLEMALEKTETCNMVGPETVSPVSLQQCPPSPPVWDVSANREGQQIIGTSSEIIKNLEVQCTETNILGASPTVNDDRYSISSECTHSSASSPCLNDSSATQPSWDHELSAEHQKENQGHWNHNEINAIDGQVKVIAGIKNMEEDRMDRFQQNVDQKTSEFLEVWNDPVDGNAISSLSSPERGKCLEPPGAFQERNLVIHHQEQNEQTENSGTVQPENTKFISPSSESDDDDNRDDEESLEKETPSQFSTHDSESWRSLNESRKFLITADSKSEGSSEPAGNENKTNELCDSQQSSLEHWDFSPLKEAEMHVPTVDKDKVPSPETGKMADTVWPTAPEMEPRNENCSKMEMLGFSTESTEWWNTSPQEGRPVASGFERDLSNSSDVMESNSSVYQNVGPWGVPIQGDTESMAVHCASPFSDKQESPFLDSNGENFHGQFWNIQPRQSDPEADQLNELVAFDQVKENNSREQGSVSFAGDELKSETPTQEQCQSPGKSAWDQPDPTLAHADEISSITSNVLTTKHQETVWWEQENSYLNGKTETKLASEYFPAVHSSTQLMEMSGSEQEVSPPSEKPEGTSTPDILHGSFQESGQLTSASPDVWMDVKQPFSLKAEGENPDILTHCSSQASSSPDIYDESDSKQAQEAVGAEGEPSELYVTKPKTDQEPDQMPKEEFILSNSELCPENTVSLPPVTEPASVDDVSQPTSLASSPESSETRDENNTGLTTSGEKANTERSPALEAVDVTVPETEKAGASIFVSHPEPVIKISSSWTAEGLSVEGQENAGALLESEQSLASEALAVVRGASPASDACLDVSDAAFDHSFSKASALNTSTGTIDDMSKLTLSEGNSEMSADGDGGKQDICSSEASWGDFEYDVMGQTLDEDLMKEPEHFLYGGDAPLEEDSLKQSLAPYTPYTPPFDLSYLTESTAAAEASENESLGSEAPEMLLSAPPDPSSKGDHSDTVDSQPGHQLVVLHIHEDPESHPLPEGTDNSALSPSSIDWEVEMENSAVPVGGDIGPADGDSKMISQLGDENIIPAKELKEIKSEYEEETCLEKNDHHVLHMDYILVNHDENLSPKTDASEAGESMPDLEEFHRDAQETGLRGALLASSPDTCQSDSFNETSPHSVERIVLTDDKRSPLESPGRDPSWMVLGHDKAAKLSSETNDSWPQEDGKTVQPVSTVTLDDGSQMQVLGEMKPADSLAVEEAFGLGSQSELSKSQKEAGPEAVLLQTVTHDNEWEMLSPQPSPKNTIPEMEMEEETEFLEPRASKPKPNEPLPEDVGMDNPFEEGMLSPNAVDMRPEPPNSLDLNGVHPRRVKLTAPNINLSLDQSEGSILSDDNLDSPDEIDINVDELDTPDEADSFEYTGHEDPTANKDPGQETESIPEYTAEEEREDNRLWRTVVIGEQEQRIDMKVIEPYRRVISHGGDSGYYGDGLNAIIVFAACFLPDSNRADYHYVMENLFLYVISTLELMVAEDYMIVYLNGATPRRKMPGLGWMKKCYQMIDRRLRKNLKSFIIVHPSWFIRTILAVTRPFISSKFSSKIKYVSSLSELSGLIPMDCIHIPESIIKYDEEKSFKRSVRLDEELREASDAANHMDLKLKEKS